jgi:hypothetical protein
MHNVQLLALQFEGVAALHHLGRGHNLALEQMHVFLQQLLLLVQAANLLDGAWTGPSAGEGERGVR